MATEAILNKRIASGEIVIGYYRDIHEDTGIGSLIAVGNLTASGNQIYRNQLYIDTLVKELAEKNETLENSLQNIKIDTNDIHGDIIELRSTDNSILKSISDL